MTITADKELDTQVTRGWKAARYVVGDVAVRGRKAYSKHHEFFDDDDHKDRIEQTLVIINKFFSNPFVYINRRGLGRTAPFTVIKVERPLFPNHLTTQVKQDQFYTPLRDLGVEIVFAKGSNSYLFRIR